MPHADIIIDINLSTVCKKDCDYNEKTKKKTAARHLEYQQTTRVQTKFRLTPIVIYVNKVPGCFTAVPAVAFCDVLVRKVG